MMRTNRNPEILIGEVPAAKRRFCSKKERRRIAEESLMPGASVAVIARSHGVNANQVFLWRRLYREGRLDANAPSAQLMPVRIAEVVSGEPKTVKFYSGAIHIEFGRTRLRVEPR